MKEIWKEHYGGAAKTLESLRGLRGVASVFNANIDAVVQATPERFLQWEESAGGVSDGDHTSIDVPGDVLRGFLECFEKGIAKEWLVSDEKTYQWLVDVVGHDGLQMGGQGGIIANVMSVVGVQKVYVHTAAHDQRQASLFLDAPNLLAGGEKGWVKANELARAGDPALIHWIIEFKKGTVIEHGGKEITCPKSNRFIATYDPLNFVVEVNQHFKAAMDATTEPIDLILMSGFQMLSETLVDGRRGEDRLMEVFDMVKAWKAAHPEALVHLEFASTQDETVRKALAEKVAPEVDSVGLNEQELIDVLKVIGEGELASACAEQLDAPHLFEGCLKAFEAFAPQRMQLHMFGLYFTLTSEGEESELLKLRDGMAMAATLAAAKAGTGSLEKAENLLWAEGHEIWGPAVLELEALAAHVESKGWVGDLKGTGIVRQGKLSLVALPTVLVEKPVSLVGMGDTISSLSLVGSLV